MTTDREMRERLNREIARMSEKENAISSKSEESFFEWLVNTIKRLFGKAIKGIQEFLEWLFNTDNGNSGRRTR